MDVYTLNFFHDNQTGNVFYNFIDYFLALFPVFTLTSSYIIIAITLTNNIKVLLKIIASYLNLNQRQLNDNLNSENDLLLDNTSFNEITSQQSHLNNFLNFEQSNEKKIFNKIILPTIVIAFPTLLSFFIDNVLLLASITGSYPGVSVQFIIPSILVIGARNYYKKYTNSLNITPKNPNFFYHWFWPYIIIVWAIFAIIIVSTNFLHFK